MNSDQLSIYLGQSAETSDFIVDSLTLWWQENRLLYSELEEWVIDLDGGSATRSNRTQFIKRMVELSQKIGIIIRLVYYPPYHSKYNPIERCWAALENYWDRAILDSIEAAVQWTRNMAWKGVAPIVHLMSGIYEKSVKPLPEVLNRYRSFWQQSETLPKWDITIVPS
jgi:Rhodopirellula transposase DDE domain